MSDEEKAFREQVALITERLQLLVGGMDQAVADRRRYLDAERALVEARLADIENALSSALTSGLERRMEDGIAAATRSLRKDFRAALRLLRKEWRAWRGLRPPRRAPKGRKRK